MRRVPYEGHETNHVVRPQIEKWRIRWVNGGQEDEGAEGAVDPTYLNRLRPGGWFDWYVMQVRLGHPIDTEGRTVCEHCAM